MKAILCSLLLLPLAGVAVAQDAALLAAEQARGILTGDMGVRWTVNVSGNKSAKFVATSQGGKIFAEVIEPADATGRRYLAEAKGDMWFWKPGLSRPVLVSKRQRLSGDAAIGDIASTSYVKGYKLQGSEPGEVNGEPATVYTLRANSLGDTYAKIRYWVTEKGHLGKRAEFYAKSDKLVRTSTMEYNNQVNGRPFLSKMVVEDAGTAITLQFSDISVNKFPASLFTRENLGGPKGNIPRI